MKRVLGLLLGLVCVLVMGNEATEEIWAHPIDVTRSEIIVPRVNDVNQMPAEYGSTAELELYIPWVEAVYLVGDESLIASPSAELLKDKLEVYRTYLAANLILINESEQCELKDVSIPEQTDSQVLLGSGLQINGQFECSQSMGRLLIHNSLFVELYPLQTNVVNIYENSKDTILHGVLLTVQSQESYVQLGGGSVQKPLQSKLNLNVGTKTNGLTDSLSERFLKVSSTSLWLAMGITFILGMLHTLETGHSKTVLAALVVHKKVRLRQGVLFASVFTVTHIADIVMMGVLFLVANSFVDVFSALPYLQVASMYSLVFIALYLFLQNLAHLVQHWFKVGLQHDDDHEHHGHGEEVLESDVDFRKQLFMGFLTGLAPCLFGWSIFMLVLSTRNLWSVFPVILSFGLGIFLALTGVVILLTKMRTKIFERQTWIGEWSPLVSSLLLLGVAVWQVMKV